MNASARLVALLGLGLTACGPRAVTDKQSREVMGTFAEVTAVARDRRTARAAVEVAYARLARVNELMSDYVAESEIGRLNRQSPGQGLALSAETFVVLEKARAIAAASGGAFDVTCRPLVALWRKASKAGRLPSEAELEAVRARVGWDKLALDAATRTVTPGVAGMEVDLGGIAKGYSLDLAAAAMREAGASGGLVNVGGDVVAFGATGDGEDWRVGIRHPFAAGLFGRLAVRDRAVATSGVQQRFTIIEGKRYSHIVDPRSGWPAAQAPSVTVIARDGLSADAWATAFSVLDVEAGRAVASGLPDIEVLWIWGDVRAPASVETPGFASWRRP